MSNEVKVAIIVSVAPTFTVLLAYWKALRGQRKVEKSVVELGQKVNGRLDELLQAKIKEAYNRGFADGMKHDRRDPRMTKK